MVYNSCAVWFLRFAKCCPRRSEAAGMVASPGCPRHHSSRLRRPVLSLANLKWRWKLASPGCKKREKTPVRWVIHFIHPPLNFRSDGGSRIRTWSSFDMFWRRGVRTGVGVGSLRSAAILDPLSGLIVRVRGALESCVQILGSARARPRAPISEAIKPN